jgi:heme/copper-type cytochrome/quinol oxidase subunit 2
VEIIRKKLMSQTPGTKVDRMQFGKIFYIFVLILAPAVVIVLSIVFIKIRIGKKGRKNHESQE